MKHMKIIKPAIVIALITLTAFNISAQKIHYNVSMDEPHTHYFDVETRISEIDEDKIDLVMAVWAPGSYLVREFSKNVENEQAIDGKGNALSFDKIKKNVWRINMNGSSELVFTYKVYAYEHSVRTSFLDATHGYMNGTSVFTYIEGKKELPSTVTFKPYKDWDEISTALPIHGKNKWNRSAPRYDILVDSPIEIGNQDIFMFEASGVNHSVAMYGGGNYDADKLKVDMAKITDECTEVFGENPNDDYLFIVHNVARGGGGLEHLNSTSLVSGRNNYSNPNRYKGFLSLVAHEYFHLWNVKRIRPLELGPFDYTQENYTNLLWVMEGFTSYYDELLLRRAGIYSTDEYLRKPLGSINSVENRPGNKVQSVADASYDAWIKYYRSNENSYNNQVSYYTKGSVIANLLDLQIIHNSKGEKNLDDVMQLLWNRYYKEKQRGFTDLEMQQAVEEIAGGNLDVFFASYINGTETPDYAKYFNYAGLKFTDLAENAEPKVYTGISFGNQGDQLFIRSLVRGGSGYDAGLNAKDEITAINGNKITKKWKKKYDKIEVGDTAMFTVKRDGKTLQIPVEMSTQKRHQFSVTRIENATKDQLSVLKAWLGE